MSAATGLRVVILISLAFVLIGGINWFIQAIAKRDLFYLIIQASKTSKPGGSLTAGFPGQLAQTVERQTMFDGKTAANGAAKWTPTVIYGVVGGFALLAIVLMIISTAVYGQAIPYTKPRYVAL